MRRDNAEAFFDACGTEVQNFGGLDKIEQQGLLAPTPEPQALTDELLLLSGEAFSAF